MTADVPAVLAHGVGLAYRSGRTGLKPLDLRVETGEVVAVLGPNGSGKSTLLRLLATDLRPTAGELSLLGQPLRRPLSSIRRRIGYAPDTPVHFEVLTGAENAKTFQTLVPPQLTGPSEPDPTGANRDRIGDLFRAFDLEDVSDIPVSEYSFGMSRKLLLLEALALEPCLLLLDEPSVGLDPRGMSALREAVRKRAGAGGTVIVASNEIREVPMWAERVLFFHRGELIEDASLSDLLARVEGRTRIEIDVAKPAPPELDLSEIEGVESTEATSAGVMAESSRGGGPLPSLVEALTSAGCGIRDIRVREPDLSDVFHSLTGEALVNLRDSSPPKSGATP